MSKREGVLLGLALLALGIVTIAIGRGYDGLTHQGADAARTCVCDGEGD